MRAAYESDMLNNKMGKPGFKKMLMLSKLLKKIKHQEFCLIFLDANGLDHIADFISMLPDGSWALSSVRSKVLDAIYKMPIGIDHLRSSKLGKTLSLLQASKKEFPSNKKLINLIKDKWSRLICNITTEYTNLEHCEKNYINMPLYEKQGFEEENVTISG